MGRDLRKRDARRSKGGASGFFRITQTPILSVLLCFVNTSFCDHTPSIL